MANFENMIGGAVVLSRDGREGDRNLVGIDYLEGIVTE